MERITDGTAGKALVDHWPVSLLGWIVPRYTFSSAWAGAKLLDTCATRGERSPHIIRSCSSDQNSSIKNIQSYH